MKSAKSSGVNAPGNEIIQVSQSSEKDKLATNKLAKKSYRRALTPSPYRGQHLARSKARPQTSLALNNGRGDDFAVEENYTRPNSTFGSSSERLSGVGKVTRTKAIPRGKTRHKSAVNSQRPLTALSKARVVWEDDTVSQDTESCSAVQEEQCQTNIKATADLLNIEKSSHAAGTGDQLKESTSGKSSQDKVRLALPQRRIGFSADAFIPGSVSSMMGSIVDSDTVEKIPDVIASSFQNFLECDASSDYETDLEEDFPVTKKAYDRSGRNLYHKLCKEEDLVPVSYLSKRFQCKEIVMRHHGLGSQGTFPIAKALVKNTFIEKLDLTDNYIEAPGAIALANMLLDNCFLTDIDLSENFLRSDGGEALAKVLLKNTSLQKLVLRSNHLTDKDAKAFADALKENRTLTYLDLSYNQIGEMGGIYLGAGVGMNYGLKHLDLSWNCIRFKGAVGVAQGLKTNDCLTNLNISWNGLSLLGCVALGRFLKKNEALESLDISNNRIGLLATQKLALGIAAHPNLKILKIGKNPIGDGGVETLLNVVKVHRTIKLLSLEDITVSPKVFDEIKQIEKERGVTIITGGIGGYKRPKEMPPGMRILLNFVQDNRLRLVDWFNQFDKDHSGGISRDEFKTGLRETGLVMTQRQLDRLIDFIDINNDGEIEYSELLRGREITIQEMRQEKKIEERQRKFEEERMRLPKLEGYDYDLM